MKILSPNTYLSIYSVPDSVLSSTHVIVNTIDKNSVLKNGYSSAEEILKEMTRREGRARFWRAPNGKPIKATE